jgi:hypothetical protein
MPLELQVIRASEFIRLNARAHLNFEASKNALQTLAHACRKRGLDRALLDLRTLPVPPKPQFTPTELAALISTFRKAGFSRQDRLAVLYSHDVYGGVRKFAFLGRVGGLQVQAFADFEGALHWLSQVQESHAEHGAAEIPISIDRKQSGRKLPVDSASGKSGKRAFRRDFRPV